MNEKAIFYAALERQAGDERIAYLNAVCGVDSQLRARVEILLHAHEQPDSFLDAPPEGLFATGPAPDLPELINSQIGPYRILEKLSEGGMGVVYVAEQTKPICRKVALKLIKPGLDTRQVITRFEAERQALTLMDHPNIATVLDAGSTETGHPYFVMDLVPGAPLTEFADKNRLNLRQRLELFVTVCQAIQHAHQKGIIHRDIKPSNVLVTLRGETAVPRVIDFGVAKATNQQLTERTIYTELGQLIGTPLYMSPEQANTSDLDVDTRSDVYSLGVLLYELLTGSTPIEKEKLTSLGYDEIRRIICEDEALRPSRRIGTLGNRLTTVAQQRSCQPQKLAVVVRGELDWIVMKALENDRARRYESASALAADVQRYLNDEPVIACPPSATYRVYKYARRNLAALTIAGILLLALLLGMAGTSWQAWRATQERDAKELALEAASANLQLAGQEREQAEANLKLVTDERSRAEANLDLALRAVDEAYLESIGEDKLLGLELAAFPIKDSRSHIWSNERPHLSKDERKLVQRGLTFYDEIAKQNPTSPQAMFESARALSRSAVLRKALQEDDEALAANREALSRLRKLTERYLARPEYLIELARACFHQALLDGSQADIEDNFDAALSATDRTLELAPDNITARILKARIYLQQRDPRAVQAFNTLYELDPHDPVYQQGLVVANGILGEWQSALDTCSQTIDLDPQNAKAWNRRGWVYGHLDQWQKAVEDHSRAIALDPTFAIAWSNRGHAWVHLDEWEKAEEDCARAIELRPASAVVWKSRAWVYSKASEWQKALEDFSQALKVNPSDACAWHSRGAAYGHLGEWQKAVEDCSRAIELDPDHAVGWADRGWVHASLGEWQKALSDCTRGIELDANDSAAWSNRGWAYANVGELEKSVNDCSRALELDPDNAAAWHYRADAFGKLGEWDRAVDDYSRAIELEPQNGAHWHNRGVAYGRLGRWQDMADDASHAIELNPEGAPSWRIRGAARLRMRDFQEAVNDLSQAIEVNGQDAKSYSDRGFAYFSMRLFPEALEDISRAIELSPDPAKLRRYRVEAYAQLKRYAQAASDLEEWIRTYGASQPGDLFALALLNQRLGQQLNDQLIRQMIARVPQLVDVEAINLAVWTCVIAPESTNDFRPVLDLAANIVARSPNRRYHSTLGAVLVRAGQYGEAIETLRSALGSSDDEETSLPATAYFFLSMAHRELGQDGEAKRCLTQAVEEAAEELSDENMHWQRRLMLELLRGEAEKRLHFEPDIDNPAVTE